MNAVVIYCATQGMCSKSTQNGRAEAGLGHPPGRTSASTRPALWRLPRISLGTGLRWVVDRPRRGNVTGLRRSWHARAWPSRPRLPFLTCTAATEQARETVAERGRGRSLRSAHTAADTVDLTEAQHERNWQVAPWLEWQSAWVSRGQGGAAAQAASAGW